MKLDVKALIKAVEVAEQCFLSEDKTGWCTSFTTSNIYTNESGEIKVKTRWDNNNYLKVEYVSPEPSKQLLYISGALYSPNKPFKYDVFIGEYHLKENCFKLIVFEPLSLNYKNLFNDFLKGQLNSQIEESINRIGEDVFNMVNLTLPPNFGSYV